MCSPAPNICHVDYDRLRQFSLNPKAPLLRVRPNRMSRNRGDVERKDTSRRRNAYRRSDSRTRICTFTIVTRIPIPDVTDAGITERKLLGHTENDGSAGLKRSGVGFVAGAMLEKDSVPPAN